MITSPAIEAAVQAFIAKLTPEQIARSNAYFEGGYWLQLWDTLLAIGVCYLLLATRISSRLRAWIYQKVKVSVLRDALYFLGVFLLITLLQFPMTIYEGYFREHQYGLSNQTLSAWFGDTLKGLGIASVLGTAFLLVIYWIIRKSPRRWWVWGTLAAFVFQIFTVVISPVYIAPVFNTYKPLPSGPVRDAVLSMAKSNNIPADEVYEFDASRQSKRVSANVSGLFGTMRISLNDNLMNTSPAEIQAVMGHEMGHYVMNHVLKSLTFVSLVILICFWLSFSAFGNLIQRHGRHWGLESAADVATFPLLLAVATFFIFLATPAFNTIIRTQEIEADMFGLNLARQPDGFAETALKLSEYRKMSPGPWEEFIFYDHPSGENRIRMAMRWKFEQLPK